jgi:hypothetical protein
MRKNNMEKLEIKKIKLEKINNRLEKTLREIKKLESIENKNLNKLLRKQRTHNLILAGTILEITLGLEKVLDKPNYHSLIGYILNYDNISLDEKNKLSQLGEAFLKQRIEDTKKINQNIIIEEITEEQIRTLLVLSKDYLIFKYMRDKMNKNFLEYLTKAQYEEIISKIKNGEIKKLERNI